MQAAGIMVWLHSDHPSTSSGRRLSSVSAGTDETGAVVGRQMFAPYGEARGGGEMAGVPWGWATHRQGEGPGLVYMRARWYAPAAGRFVSADTVVPEPGSPQAFNRYAYLLGNPTNFADFSGHFSPEQVEAYLRNTYGDEQWWRYWEAWKSDKVFWEMLMAADYGDMLFAPTTALGPGRFTENGETFAFDNHLERYQGNGPYRLTVNGGNYDKLKFESSITTHLVDTEGKRSQVWEQPLYRYGPNGPTYSGYNRRVSCRYVDTQVNLLAGDGLPWFATYAVPQALDKIGVFNGHPVAKTIAGVVMFVVGTAGFVNESIAINFILEPIPVGWHNAWHEIESTSQWIPHLG